ncbi:MAG: UPF0489 family protein [Clostridioides sp.]|jgi:hypothetical protein|nr:UPF0489 family protein [Clostridioides sp.]
MDRYTGFYIDEPVGNNVFSYEERKNKSIYVPKLIEGDLGDVRIGNHTTFNEVDGGVEIVAKGLENFVVSNIDGKRIYVFDNHNHAFYFWIKSLHEGLFEKGVKLVHVDQHKDTRRPDDLKVDIEDMDDVFRYTNSVLNVGSFIMPAIEHGVFSSVEIIDSTYSLDRDIDGDYVLDIDLDIFSPDMDYIDYDYKMDRIRRLVSGANVITIATSPYFINQDRAIEVMHEILKND